VQMMEKFRRRWPQIQRRRRVVIHIPSISAEEHVRWGIPHFSTRQNLQMARLCAIADPMVDVIYVAPFALTDDLRSYYQKLLAIGGVDDVSHRFKVVVPENLSRFPDTISLTSAVLYSPRCLRRIKHFARGKEAYIVPGVVGPEDKRLSMYLNVSLLACVFVCGCGCGCGCASTCLGSPARVKRGLIAVVCCVDPDARSGALAGDAVFNQVRQQAYFCNGGCQRPAGRP